MCWFTLGVGRLRAATQASPERQRGSLRVVKYKSRAPSPNQPAVGRSNGSDSRKRLQSGLRLGRAQGLPLAVGALVAEVGQVGVLRREQPVLLGLGFRPRSGEGLERGRFSARPELHREHARNGAIPKPAGGQVAEQSHDTLEFLRVPTIVEAVARSKPCRWILLADDLRRDAGGLTDMACPEIAADTRQHDRLSIGVLRGLHLPVRVLGHDPVRDSALRTEAANLLEVHVVQLSKEPRPLACRELRQEVRHPNPFTCPTARRPVSRLPPLHRRCRAALSSIASPVGFVVEPLEPSATYGGPPHFTQVSTFRAGTRLNSATLSVTHTASIARACAAISMSCAPIGVPFLSGPTRIDA